MMIEPKLFENLLDRFEQLEDYLDGLQAIAEYMDNPEVAVDVEEVFTQINQGPHSNS